MDEKVETIDTLHKQCCIFWLGDIACLTHCCVPRSHHVPIPCPWNHTDLWCENTAVPADPSFPKPGLLTGRAWLCFRSSVASILMHTDGDTTPASCMVCVQRAWVQTSLCAVILAGEKGLVKVLGNSCFSVAVMQHLILYFHVAIFPSLPEIFVPCFVLPAVVSHHLFSATLLLSPPCAEVTSWFRSTSQNSWNIAECR